MPKTTDPLSVPKSMQDTYAAVTALTDAVCRESLNDEYRDLARRMTALLCRKRPSPLASGQPRTWACGILYELGQINFMTDPAAKPHLSMADLAARLGVGESTAHAKGRILREMLHLRRFDHTWMLPSRIDENIIVWMVSVNGFYVDIRTMPREVQELAFEKGLIPYIPADRADEPDEA